jgi:hypothetical protein
MWKYREAKKMEKNLRGIRDLSQGIYLLAQQRMNSSQLVLENIRAQLSLISPFLKNPAKNQNKTRILLVDQELFGPEEKYEGSYDYVLGESGEKMKNYLGPLEDSGKFLGLLEEKFGNEDLEFIIAGQEQEYLVQKTKKYHRSNFGSSEELERYYKKLSRLFAFYSQRLLENKYRYRLMSGAKKNAQKLMEKYSAVARNEVVKASSEQLIINSIIIGEKND